MLKKTVRLSFFLIVLTICSLAIHASEPTRNVLELAKRSVVVVKTFDRSGRSLLQGSGFFISCNRVVTDLHVLEGAERILVEPFRGKSVSAIRISSGDEPIDLALLETDATDASITILNLEHSRPLNGDSLFVVSNPRGSNRKVTTGIVDSFWSFGASGDLMRITAAIAPGSSGGPVLNLRGDVIGIAVSHAESSEDLNFAIPVESLAALAAKYPGLNRSPNHSDQLLQSFSLLRARQGR